MVPNRRTKRNRIIRKKDCLYDEAILFCCGCLMLEMVILDFAGGIQDLVVSILDFDGSILDFMQAILEFRCLIQVFMNFTQFFSAKKLYAAFLHRASYFLFAIRPINKLSL